MTSQLDKPNELKRLADLIELAATWCDSTASAEKFEPVAGLWRKRAEMLRTGYQPMLVRHRADTPSATTREEPDLLCPKEWQSETGHFDPAGYDVNDCAGCGRPRHEHSAEAPPTSEHKMVAHPDKDGPYLACADGEGSHEFRICQTKEAVFAFYEEMCGRDQDDTLDSITKSFEDDDCWRNDRTAFELELYCAHFYVWKVSEAELARSAMAHTHYEEVGYINSDCFVEWKVPPFNMKPCQRLYVAVDMDKQNV